MRQRTRMMQRRGVLLYFESLLRQVFYIVHSKMGSVQASKPKFKQEILISVRYYVVAYFLLLTSINTTMTQLKEATPPLFVARF